jgi:hypothetical protein
VLEPVTGKDGASAPEIQPEAGMMVMFPSWMPHSVDAYLGESTRISIAFNLALPGGAS